MMEPPFTETAEIEHGPLSDADESRESRDLDQENPEEGLPSQYFAQSGGAPQEVEPKTFVGLRAEETSSSSAATFTEDEALITQMEMRKQQEQQQQRAKDAAAKLKLDLRLDIGDEEDYDISSSGIMFSPGGSEAYMFTQGALDAANDADDEEQREDIAAGSKVYRSGKEHGTPREIKDPIFIERRQQKVAARSPAVQQSSPESLRFGPEVARTAGYDSSVVSTAESSPRHLAVLDDRGNRRRLPLVPMANNPAFQDQDFRMNHSEIADDSDYLPPSPLDRAASPSGASVASATSSMASGMLSGRRNLEWDSGADLGYLGDVQQQHDAAASLSTLEKLAIGNYSSFLSSKPEGKSSREPGSRDAAARRMTSQERRADMEEEMRQARLIKFANSLLRPRAMVGASNISSVPPHSASSPRRQQQRSRSRESKLEAKSDSATSEASLRHHRKSRKQFGSPVKSSSLTDLQGFDLKQSPKLRTFRSNSDVSQHLLPQSLRNMAAGFSEPSSCSSTTTVVPTVLDDHRHRFLHPINTDPASLPLHLQGLFPGSSSVYSEVSIPSFITSQQKTKETFLKSQKSSQASLSSSRRSGSRSFETVINVEQRRTATASRWSTKANLNSDSYEDSDNEDKVVKEVRQSAYFKSRQDPGKRAPPNAPRPAWHDQLLQEGKLQRKFRLTSAATSSDEEKPRDGKGGGRRRHRRATMTTTTTASSTMDSAQIDRAKSFEYFPGESFPMQENSSSYEYLPGHLVMDRPGTVVSNYRDDKEMAVNTSGVTSLSSNTAMETTPSSSDQQQQSRRRLDLGHVNPSLLDAELHHIADHLNERSKELLQAHIRKTKRFYKRMKRYIAFVSAPPVSTEDSRRKQEILDKLMSVLKNEDDASQGTSNKQHSQHQQSQAADTSEESEATTREVATMETQEASIAPPPPPSQGATGAKVEQAVAVTEKLTVMTAVHERRTEQMRMLRKEVKKLEKMEFSNLGRIMESLDIAAVSDNDRSSTISSTTMSNASSVHEKKQHSTKGGPAATAVDGRTYGKRTKPKSDIKDKARSIAVRASGGAGSVGLRSGRVSGSTSTKNFGQTFPTPREQPAAPLQAAAATLGGKSKKYATKSVQTGPAAERKPVAYYLPMGGREGPLRFGKRIMKENKGEEPMGKENRSILANYIAAVDSAALELQPKPKPKREKPADSEKETAPQRSLMTLKDALATKKPEFIRRAEERRRLLRKNKEQRLRLAEKKRKWLEEVARQSPFSRLGHPPKVPNFEGEGNVRRLFDYREMVQKTRRRYQELPEVRQKEYDRKRMASGRTNRVMREMYKRKLQENVLRGKVSLMHHLNVV